MRITASYALRGGAAVARVKADLEAPDPSMRTAERAEAAKTPLRLVGRVRVERRECVPLGGGMRPNTRAILLRFFAVEGKIPSPLVGSVRVGGPAQAVDCATKPTGPRSPSIARFSSPQGLGRAGAETYSLVVSILPKGLGFVFRGRARVVRLPGDRIARSNPVSGDPSWADLDLETGKPASGVSKE